MYWFNYFSPQINGSSLALNQTSLYKQTKYSEKFAQFLFVFSDSQISLKQNMHKNEFSNHQQCFMIRFLWTQTKWRKSFFLKSLKNNWVIKLCHFICFIVSGVTSDLNIINSWPKPRAGLRVVFEPWTIETVVQCVNHTNQQPPMFKNRTLLCL